MVPLLFLGELRFKRGKTIRERSPGRLEEPYQELGLSHVISGGWWKKRKGADDIRCVRVNRPHSTSSMLRKGGAGGWTVKRNNFKKPNNTDKGVVREGGRNHAL